MRMGLGNLLTTENHLRRVWEIIQNGGSGLSWPTSVAPAG
jgi:hypothetical protein